MYVDCQDDMHIRVYNYNTLERVHQFEAHSDYLRSIAVHPTQTFILTSSGTLTSSSAYPLHRSTFWLSLLLSPKFGRRPKITQKVKSFFRMDSAVAQSEV